MQAKWHFHAATGFISSKEDAAAESVVFTYTQAGQIKTRTLARGVVTTYGYSATTCELLTQTYSDSTPSVTYAYNRLGQSATVADVTGTRTFNYNLAGTLELQNEILGTSGSDFYGDHRITRGYDTTTGVVGRYKRLSVGNSSNAYADYDMSYGYDGLGRLNSSYIFNYTYLTNSNLIQTTAYSGWNYTDTRAYDGAHNWVDSRTTTISSTTKTAFAYTQDNLGRVTQVAKTGEVYNRYGNGTEGLTTYYGYDDKSQLTSEVTKVGAGSTVLTGRNDSAYAYDTLGNRTTVTHNGNTSTYTVNALNQYTQRTVPGYFDVAGFDTAGTVTVAKSGGPTDTATRHGDYFFDAYALTNTSNPILESLTITGSSSATLPAYVEKTPQAMTYDDDGNITSDGRWTFTYDGENRLITMETAAAAVTAGVTRQKLTFGYDYLGRRVSKMVQSDWSGSDYTSTDLSERILYDGWNPIQEYDALSSLAKIRAHVWGLDLSGSLQGAGGVGGLLYTKDVATGVVMLPMYDAMGNIHGYIKHSDGSIVAAYEYDAFGNTLRESGTLATAAPFRFSTKYTDIETGLVYYGKRYYSPSLGRFINRDPIEEQGGVNLYSFVGNNAVNAWDYLGMDKFVAPNEDGDWVEMDGNPFDLQWNSFVGRANSTSGVSPSGSDMVGIQEFTDTFNANAAALNAYYNAVPGSWSNTSIGPRGDNGFVISGSVKEGGITISDHNDNVHVQLAQNEQTGEWRDFANSASGVAFAAPINAGANGSFDMITGSTLGGQILTLNQDVPEGMKNNPPNHPGYKEPKNGDGKKRKNPNGKGAGFPDNKENIWIPTNHGGTHRPHWDQQNPNGGHENVYPLPGAYPVQPSVTATQVTIGVGVGAVILVLIDGPLPFGDAAAAILVGGALAK